MLGSTSDDDEIKKLLALALQTPKEGDDVELNEVERFVISEGIKEGDTKITPTMFWNRYLEWAEKPMSRYTFWKLCKRVFNIKKGVHSHFYLLNAEPFDLTKDTYWEWRRSIRERKKACKLVSAREEKANKKVKDKISGSEEGS